MMLVEEKDKRFYIKESNIKDAGMGVFASEDIKKESYLEIIGVMVNVGSVSDQCTDFAKDYKFAAQYEDKYTRHIIPMGYAAIINHATEEKDQNATIRFINKNNKNPAASSAVYFFTKDIKKDDEILGNYGEKWQTRIAEDADWQMFLDLELYNLKKLKR